MSGRSDLTGICPREIIIKKMQPPFTMTALSVSAATKSADPAQNRGIWGRIRHPDLVSLAVLLCIAIGTARIVSTYGLFSQTFDEPAHLACGIEFLDRGVYLYEPQHPPLARLALAIGPYLDGSRYVGTGSIWTEGNAILRERNSQRTLTLARMGILPFYWLSAAIVWFWARSLFGRPSALVAALLYTSLPPILAHSGLATTDMAVTAFLTVALYSLVRWVENATRLRGVLLGAAIAGAVLSKFTTLLFFPLCVVVLAGVIWFNHRLNRPALWREFRFRLRKLPLVAATTILLVWAGYGFSLRQVSTSKNRPHAILTAWAGSSGMIHNAGNFVIELPIPGSELIKGFVWAGYHVKNGHPAYLLGHARTNGWWYFFPVALAVKTPLAFLILVGIAIVALARTKPWKWQPLAPLIFAGTIVSACLPATINLGIRHILPIYPLLSIVAGFGAVEMFRRFRARLAGRLVPVGLVAWCCVSSALAHPFYLSYFNELAGKHPENILVESDLDWGQELDSLSRELQRVHAASVSLGYFGSADLNEHNLPPVTLLTPYTPVTGWVAISLTTMKMQGVEIEHAMGKSTPAYAWLEQYRPVATLGKAMRLYYIPPPLKNGN